MKSLSQEEFFPVPESLLALITVTSISDAVITRRKQESNQRNNVTSGEIAIRVEEEREKERKKKK